MYLKFFTNLEFPVLGKHLVPEMSELALDWDSENVYEWMYLDFPDRGLCLNLSREHGWANIEDALLAEHRDNEAKLKRLVQPGSVYVFGWDRKASTYIDVLPESLASEIADTLNVEVYVYAGRINVDIPDSAPTEVIKPSNSQR